MTSSWHLDIMDRAHRNVYGGSMNQGEVQHLLLFLFALIRGKSNELLVFSLSLSCSHIEVDIFRCLWQKYFDEYVDECTKIWWLFDRDIIDRDEMESESKPVRLELGGSRSFSWGKRRRLLAKTTFTLAPRISYHTCSLVPVSRKEAWTWASQDKLFEESYWLDVYSRSLETSRNRD